MTLLGQPFDQLVKRRLPGVSIQPAYNIEWSCPCVMFMVTGARGAEGRGARRDLRGHRGDRGTGLDPELLAATVLSERMRQAKLADDTNAAETASNILAAWGMAGDPLAFLADDDYDRNLQNALDAGAFDAVLEKYLANPGATSLLVSTGAPGLKEEQDAERSRQLADKKAAMSEEEIAASRSTTKWSAGTPKTRGACPRAAAGRGRAASARGGGRLHREGRGRAAGDFLRGGQRSDGDQSLSGRLVDSGGAPGRGRAGRVPAGHDLQRKLRRDGDEQQDGRHGRQHRHAACRHSAGGRELRALRALFDDASRTAVDYSRALAMPRNIAATYGSNAMDSIVALPFEDLGMEYNGKLLAFASAVTSLVLSPVMRHSYSVYSPELEVNREMVELIAYRDPRLWETFTEVLPALSELVRALNLRQEELDGYITNAYSMLAAPKGPFTGASMAIEDALRNRDSFERTRMRMRELKQMTPENLTAYADILDSLATDGARVTVGNPRLIAGASELFDEVDSWLTE